MIEEHLYWACVHDRWIDERNWATLKETYFFKVPGLVRGPVSAFVRRQVRAQLAGQGMGRHAPEDIARLALEDLKALETLLAGKPFLTGDKPRGLDATAGPFISGILASPHETEIVRGLRTMQPLVDYAARVREAIYPKDL